MYAQRTNHFFICVSLSLMEIELEPMVEIHKSRETVTESKIRHVSMVIKCESIIKESVCNHMSIISFHYQFPTFVNSSLYILYKLFTLVKLFPQNFRIFIRKEQHKYVSHHISSYHFKNHFSTDKKTIVSTHRLHSTNCSCSYTSAKENKSYSVV